MAISGQEIINVGVVNQATGSDDLYTAFSKVENNFTTLFSTSSVYSNFVAGYGVTAVSNPSTGTVTITNTGVTQLTSGSGITLSGSNGNITISVSGSGTGTVVAGVTNVGISSNTLSISNSPVISKGVIAVDLPNIAGTTYTPGRYTNPTVTVDQYGRISNIANNTISGTVTSVAMTTSGTGIGITGGPITTTGTFTITNTGVTKVIAGTGINLSGSTGDITISAISGGGTVTRVDVASSSLAITGSPITNLGTIGIELKNDASFSGNVSATTMNVTGSGVDVLKVSGTANIVKDLYVGGNIYVPNLISTNSTTLEVSDPLVYLAASTPSVYNYEIGFYSHFVTGGIYQHTGIVRNHSDNNWTFFSNVAEPSGGTVDLSNANIILDNVKVGNIISLNANLGNVVRGNFFIGAGNSLSNIQGANVSGVVANATYAVSASSAVTASTASTVTASAQGNITSVGTLTSLAVTGNITSGNASLGNLVTSNYFTGVLTTGAQPNITTVGTLGNLSVTSNVSSGNLSVTTMLTTGNITTTNGIFWANGAPYSPPAPNILMATIAANVAVATTTVTSINIDGAVSYTGNVLIFDNVAIDTETGYSTSNGKYTPTVAGYYQIETSFSPYVVSFGSGSPPSSLLDGTLYFVVLVKNGTTVVGIGEQVGGGLGYGGTGFAYTGFTQSSINTVVRMNGTTDYLQVFLVASIKSGSFTTGSLMSNYLQAIWLRP